MEKLIERLGFLGAVGMPFFNIPLIWRIVKRRSSADISLGWLFGVWGCIVIMAPAAFVSKDPILRGFEWSNLLLFSAVVVIVLRFRKAFPPKP
jgi:hypothetical protein